jgi:hypothetical protein
LLFGKDADAAERSHKPVQRLWLGAHLRCDVGGRSRGLAYHIGKTQASSDVERLKDSESRRQPEQPRCRILLGRSLRIRHRVPPFPETR